jgi:putative ABC transport system permease protein
MELWIGALNLGLLYAFLALGTFVTYRIQNLADVTVDGSFTLGAALAAILLVLGVHPLLATAAAVVGGALAGAVTAFLHTRFRINALLAGILVMTALYSVNLHVMGRANIPLLQTKTVFTIIERSVPVLRPELRLAVVLSSVVLAYWAFASAFLRTDFGLSLRGAGNNPVMAAAGGVNVNRMVLFSVALGNGHAALTGALVAQYQGFADVSMGVGTVVLGMASVILGESLARTPNVFVRLLGVIVGAIIFRFLVALALFVGLNPVDLKLLTAGFVLATLVASGKLPSLSSLSSRWPRGRWAAAGVLGLAGIALAVWAFRPKHEARVPLVGIVQYNDNPVLDRTREAFLEEMGRLGYRDGVNVQWMVHNAQGDTPTLRSIVDAFARRRPDLVLTISTPATQAALGRLKDCPIVFATIASPFIIQAGQSDTDHLPNVTGTYGAVPMDKMVEVVQRLLPRARRLGTMWDPSATNSAVNAEQFIAAAKAAGLTVEATHVTTVTEVQQATEALAQKNIDAIVLVPDNLVFSGLDAVLKVTKPRKLPLVISDQERMEAGALAAIGHDYALSGIQAARIAHRILQGESPKDIPFEPYRNLMIRLNAPVAKELGVIIAPDLQAEADRSAQQVAAYLEEARRTSIKPRRVAVFSFSDSVVLADSERGLLDELRDQGWSDREHLTIDIKNAQGDFATANAIAEDIVRLRYDFIITISTIALQTTAKANRSIPHVFGTVTDPLRAGIGTSFTSHQSNLTGLATMQPVRTTVRVIRELFPKAKRIGILWNPSEASSEVCTFAARVACKEYGFELVELHVSASGELVDAVHAMLKKDIDVFFTSGDVTVSMGVDTVAALLARHNIPYVTNAPSDVDHGAFMGLGANYYDVGRVTGKLAKRVMGGARPEAIAIESYTPEQVALNLRVAQQIGVVLSSEFVAKASKVVR